MDYLFILLFILAFKFCPILLQLKQKNELSEELNSIIYCTFKI